MRSRRSQAALVFGLWLGALPAGAGTLEGSVRGAGGEPVANAVVYAAREDAGGRAAAPPERVEIDQVDKEYVPHVTAVPVGTRIYFPNRDQIRHHVYSFSPAKIFEIPLYEGTPSEPILFDKPGPVTLGCNIHDWMKAFVFVSETPDFALTGADGRARLEGLAPGDYQVRVWHPRLVGPPEATTRRVSVGDGTAAVEFAIEQQREWRPRRAPDSGREPRY